MPAEISDSPHRVALELARWIAQNDANYQGEEKLLTLYWRCRETVVKGIHPEESTRQP